ncbi:gibberellin receptor GID1C-like [Vigna umbellata]|uniref:gibberellin receptor GID1C-like n=1 Tax=Vigna umbellata TaxID=87088 RepID=UPI001F5F988D|nr:gibberellin receptor GID1C-like [Vigna umbellata]
MVVSLNMWVLISNFKLAYNLLCRPDGTFNRDLAEFLDRKVPANANLVDGVFSFDVIVDRETNLLTRIYRPAEGEKRPVSILELEKPVSSEVGPVIIFFHGGGRGGRGAETGSFWNAVEDEVRFNLKNETTWHDSWHQIRPRYYKDEISNEISDEVVKVK